jgi:polar amino acid transport system substrate-binding protein
VKQHPTALLRLPARSWLRAKTRACCFLIFTLLAVYMASATAIAAPIEVSIYADQDYPPYSYTENGKLKGIYTEILADAFKKMPKYHVHLIAVPWKRGLSALESGEGFALYPPYYRPTERPYMQYSDSFFTELVVVFCNQAAIEKKELKAWPDDYFGLTIGMNPGFLTGGPKFDQAVMAKKVYVDTNATSRSNMLKLLIGRIDCYVNDRLMIESEYKKIKLGPDFKVSALQIQETSQVSVEKVFLGYTNRDSGRYAFKDDFIQEFNKVISGMKQNGDITKITNSFMGRN